MYRVIEHTLASKDTVYYIQRRKNLIFWEYMEDMSFPNKHDAIAWASKQSNRKVIKKRVVK